MRGLVTAVVQDANTKEVLTVAYMNKESLAKTIDSGKLGFILVPVKSFGIREQQVAIHNRWFQSKRIAIKML